MGRPKGSQNERIWRDAIRAAVSEKVGSHKKLRILASRLVDNGIGGDTSALKEIGDRLDGKAPQALVGGTPDDNPIALAFIELRAVQPK